MKRVICILWMLLFAYDSFGQSASGTTQEESTQIEVHFNQARYTISPDISQNDASLSTLARTIDELTSNPLTTITQIDITGYTSPEGGVHYNQKLSQRRSDALYRYMTGELGVDASLITKHVAGIDWAGLRSLVAESDMQHREKVLSIIDNTPEETWRKVTPSDKYMTLVDSRNKHLMDLELGRPYHYMYDHFFPQLRRGAVVTLYFRTVNPPLFNDGIGFADSPLTRSALAVPAMPENLMAAASPSAAASSGDDNAWGMQFALKTNLLFDVATALNVELEVPIGDRWSVAGEWIFPWWVTADNGNALEVLAGNVEGRYWFGDRANRAKLTGWFAGIYAGGGLYDLQWKNNGYQGEFYIAAGASAGYAHTLNKSGNLRMEYSLGLGYLSTEYRYYEGRQDNEFLVWQHDGKYTLLGPTRAKVSLVWFIDWQKGGKR